LHTINNTSSVEKQCGKAMLDLATHKNVLCLLKDCTPDSYYYGIQAEQLLTGKTGL